jgi:hypothetical protein
MDWQMKVIKNSDGRVINIGPWDYCVSRDDNGDEIITNPMPPGAYEAEADVVQGWDSGLYLADDPRRLGPQ